VHRAELLADLGAFLTLAPIDGQRRRSETELWHEQSPVWPRSFLLARAWLDVTTTCPTLIMTMKTVSARKANHQFSDLLSRVEHGEEILITKRNKPVAVLSPYRPPLMTPERERAVQHAIDVMEQGLPWGGTLRRFRREEMHEL
jgi:prevent-host-death family protein